MWSPEGLVPPCTPVSQDIQPRASCSMWAPLTGRTHPRSCLVVGRGVPSTTVHHGCPQALLQPGWDPLQGTFLLPSAPLDTASAQSSHCTATSWHDPTQHLEFVSCQKASSDASDNPRRSWALLISLSEPTDAPAPFLSALTGDTGL